MWCVGVDWCTVVYWYVGCSCGVYSMSLRRTFVREVVCGGVCKVGVWECGRVLRCTLCTVLAWLYLPTTVPWTVRWYARRSMGGVPVADPLFTLN